MLIIESYKQFKTCIHLLNFFTASIYNQPKLTPEERNDYEKVRAWTHYHVHSGKLSQLQHQYKEKLQLSQGTTTRSSSSPGNKCIYGEGSWKCGEKIVPCTKYCSKHILHDANQVLFKACGVTKGANDDECIIPIIPLPHSPACIYHAEIPEAINVGNPVEEFEMDITQDSTDRLRPKIIDLSDSSTFIVTEVPPENVMEDDGKEEIEIAAKGCQQDDPTNGQDSLSLNMNKNFVTK